MVFQEHLTHGKFKPGPQQPKLGFRMNFFGDAIGNHRCRVEWGVDMEPKMDPQAHAHLCTQTSANS